MRATLRKRQRSLSIDTQKFSGDHCGGETPDPIPNSAVKSSSADGTAEATLWESRSSPRQSPRPEASVELRAFFFSKSMTLGIPGPSSLLAEAAREAPAACGRVRIRGAKGRARPQRSGETKGLLKIHRSDAVPNTLVVKVGSTPSFKVRSETSPLE